VRTWPKDGRDPGRYVWLSPLPMSPGSKDIALAMAVVDFTLSNEGWVDLKCQVMPSLPGQIGRQAAMLVQLTHFPAAQGGEPTLAEETAFHELFSSFASSAPISPPASAQPDSARAEETPAPAPQAVNVSCAANLQHCAGSVPGQPDPELEDSMAERDSCARNNSSCSSHREHWPLYACALGQPVASYLQDWPMPADVKPAKGKKMRAEWADRAAARCARDAVPGACPPVGVSGPAAAQKMGTARPSFADAAWLPW
jgi:hypothetical protein